MILIWFAAGQYPVGPNLAVRRQLLDRSGFIRLAG